MSSGYKGGGNYRKYSAGGYRPSSYSRRKRRNLIRLRNRIIIVSTGVIALILVITLFSMFLKNCLCAGCVNENKTIQIATETINTEPTGPVTNNSTGTTNSEQPENLSFVTPAVTDDGSSDGQEYGGLYLWNNIAFRPFTGDTSSAEKYADAISTAKKKLGNDINVYSMLLPTQVELRLPDRLKNSEGGLDTNSQSKYIESAYKALDDPVTSVNGYNQLADHCNEYIYFNGDYRLTALGGYYCYLAFAQQKGLEAVALDSMKKNSVKNYSGYYNYGNELGLPKETIDYWESENYNVKLEFTNVNGRIAEDYSCFYNVENEDDQEKIKVFHQGSYPMVKFTSDSPKANGKICIVQDDFSNAMVSYFTYNYEEVYLLDIDKCQDSDTEESIKSLCKDNGITDVLFVNNTASSASDSTAKNIKNII